MDISVTCRAQWKVLAWQEALDSRGLIAKPKDGVYQSRHSLLEQGLKNLNRHGTIPTNPNGSAANESYLFVARINDV
jgi:hypothetical protein